MGSNIRRPKSTPWRGYKKFGLRMSCKQWKCDYESLLTRTDLPSLNARRIITKLYYLAKTLHGAAHSSTPLPEFRNMDSRLRSFQDSMIHLSFAKTNTYKNSYYPDSIALWNQLPPAVRASLSLRALKKKPVCPFCSRLLLIVLGVKIFCKN